MVHGKEGLTISPVFPAHLPTNLASFLRKTKGVPGHPWPSPLGFTAEECKIRNGGRAMENLQNSQTFFKYQPFVE